jgi:hypothetical protein
MDTDDVSSLADYLNRAANEIIDTAHDLRRSANRLNGKWHGGRSDQFLGRLSSAANAAANVAEDAVRLSRRVRAEVDEWQQVDAALNGRPPITPLPPNPPGDYKGGDSDGNDDPWWYPGNLFGVLTGLGMSAVHQGADFIADRYSEAVHANDSAINKALSYFLRSQSPGSNESVHFQTEGDVTIHSVKIKGGSDIELVRLANGKYEVVISGSIMGGGHGSGGAEGHANWREREYGVSPPSVSGEVLGGYASEMVFEFDPNDPGDMTRLSLFLAGLGAAQMPVLMGPLASSNAMALPMVGGLENLKKVEFAKQGEGSAEFGIAALVELVGAEVGGHFDEAAGLEKNEAGQWEVIGGATVKTTSSFNAGLASIGAEAGVTGEHIHNPHTGEDYTRVTIDVQAAEGGGLNLSELDGLISESAYQKLAVDMNQYERVIIEYEIDGNVVEIGSELINDGEIVPGSALDQAKITMKMIQGEDFQVGAGGEVGAGVAYGLEGNYEVGRSSEMVYVYDPATEAWQAL